uniref:Uncharacterized protein n=1 Tax=Heterorhabditis bacteriophora TaxID=37862 RepID=A0A1I7XJK7_HETBA
MNCQKTTCPNHPNTTMRSSMVDDVTSYDYN